MSPPDERCYECSGPSCSVADPECCLADAQGVDGATGYDDKTETQSRLTASSWSTKSRMRRGKARSNQFPPELIRRADFPEFCGPTNLDLLTENQRALPMLWKRP